MAASRPCSVQTYLIRSHPVRLVRDGSQPSTGTAGPPPVLSSSPSKPSLSCMQGQQISPVFQPSAERCSALLHALQSAPWPANSSARQSVSMTSQGSSGYYNFGVQILDRSSLTAVTRLLPQLLQKINAFLSEVWPYRYMECRLRRQEHHRSCPS